MKLTKEQINRFKEDGFLILKKFAPNSICEEILEKAKKHLEKKITPIESEQEYTQVTNKNVIVRRLRQVYHREEVFKNWMTNENIKPILTQLLQDEPILTLAHHNSIMTKMPKESSRTFWHQDRRYWNFENDDLISVWLSLDDEFLENGVLEFIKGSHKIEFSKEQFDTNTNFKDDVLQNQELIKQKTHTNLSKGDVVLFHCKTLHHANKNITNRAKISFVYTVRAKSNLPIKGTRSDFEEVVL